MNDTPAQGTPPLWSDERIGELTKSMLTQEPNHTPKGLVRRVTYAMREDYEADRQRLIAEADQLRAELSEKQAYILTLERALGEATELDSPDGEGYWEFTGRIEGSSVEKVQWLVMVRFAKLDKQYYAYRFGGMTIRANLMIGAWKRIYTSWERRTSSSPAAASK